MPVAAGPKAKSKRRAKPSRAQPRRARVSDRIARPAPTTLPPRSAAWCGSARAKRGMTRRQLAEQSGASERYLAQIESGQGNPSVIILKGIADALDVPVVELLPRSRRRSGGARPHPRSARARAAVRAARDRRADRRPHRGRSRRRPRAAHRAGRPARRRQVDARTHAGAAPRRALHRARPPDRAGIRRAHSRPGRDRGARDLPPLRARLPRTRDRRARGRRDRHRRRHRLESRRPTGCCCGARTRSGSRRGRRSTCAA